MFLFSLIWTASGGTKTFEIIKGSGFGSSSSRIESFNQVVSEYFQVNFGNGGSSFLEQFGTVTLENLSDTKFVQSLIAQIDKILSTYGKTLGGAIKSIVPGAGKDIHIPRARVHLVMGFIDITRAAESDLRTAAFSEINEMEELDEKTQRTKDSTNILPRIKKGLNDGIDIFGPVVAGIIIRLTTTIGWCPRIRESVMSSQYVLDGTAKNTLVSINGLTRLGLIGVVTASVELCTKDPVSRPLICEPEFGQVFLRDILTKVTHVIYDCGHLELRIHKTVQFWWTAFHPDFVFNRLTTSSAGDNTKLAFKGLLKIFSSYEFLFTEIVTIKDAFLRTFLGPYYPQNPANLGKVPTNTPLTPEEANTLETFLTEKITILCEKAKEKNIVLKNCPSM